MDLPRFSSGQIGNLTFAHLNEAFSLLDRLRPLLNGNPDLFAASDAFVTARIESEVSTGVMRWTEVVAGASSSNSTAASWVTREGGMKSGLATDTDFAPAISLDGNSLAAGTIVTLRHAKRLDGKRFWTIVGGAGGGGSDVFMAIIRGSEPAEVHTDQKVYRWAYDWDEARLAVPPQANRDFIALEGGRQGRTTGGGFEPPAFNGAERNGIVGCGGGGTSVATVANAPIQSGVVVMMVKRISSYTFSLGNTLQVTCIPPP